MYISRMSVSPIFIATLLFISSTCQIIYIPPLKGYSNDTQVSPRTEVVAFTGELDETEEGAGELGVVHVLLARAPVGAHAQALCLRVALEGVQVEHGAGVHEAGDGQEERSVFLLLQVVQHSLEIKTISFVTNQE